MAVVQTVHPQKSLCQASHPSTFSESLIIVAGLISPDFGNILTTPADNAAVFNLNCE